MLREDSFPPVESIRESVTLLAQRIRSTGKSKSIRWRVQEHPKWNRFIELHHKDLDVKIVNKKSRIIETPQA